MKIDVNRKLVDIINGKPLVVDETGTVLTLGGVILQSLFAPLENDEKLSTNEKVDIFKSSLKIADAIKAENGEVNLSSEEITIIKDRISKCFAILVTGQACMMLEEEITLT